MNFDKTILAQGCVLKEISDFIDLMITSQALALVVAANPYLWNILQCFE